MKKELQLLLAGSLAVPAAFSGSVPVFGKSLSDSIKPLSQERISVVNRGGEAASGTPYHPKQTEIDKLTWEVSSVDSSENHFTYMRVYDEKYDSYDAHDYGDYYDLDYKVKINNETGKDIYNAVYTIAVPEECKPWVSIRGYHYEDEDEIFDIDHDAADLGTLKLYKNDHYYIKIKKIPAGDDPIVFDVTLQVQVGPGWKKALSLGQKCGWKDNLQVEDSTSEPLGSIKPNDSESYPICIPYVYGDEVKENVEFRDSDGNVIPLDEPILLGQPIYMVLYLKNTSDITLYDYTLFLDFGNSDEYYGDRLTAFEIEGEPVSDSGAICRYIDDNPSFEYEVSVAEFKPDEVYSITFDGSVSQTIKESKNIGMNLMYQNFDVDLGDSYRPIKVHVRDMTEPTTLDRSVSDEQYKEPPKDENTGDNGFGGGESPVIPSTPNPKPEESDKPETKPEESDKNKPETKPEEPGKPPVHKWDKNKDGKWELTRDGEPVKNELVTVDGGKYLINEKGHMETGWKKNALTGNKWMYFDHSGLAKQDGWLKHENEWYFFGSDAAMHQSNWITDKNETYYLTSNGTLAQSRWLKKDGKDVYVDSSGKIKKGWLFWSSNWYYMDPVDGHMHTGGVISGWTIRVDGTAFENK